MKMTRLAAIILSITLLMSACSLTDTKGKDKTDDELENMSEQIAQAESERLIAESAIASQNDQIESLQAVASDLTLVEENLAAVQREYDAYKDQMTPYESLEAAEAEARQIEADRIIREEQEAEQSRQESVAASESLRQQQEAEQKAKEEAQGYETGITYEQIARNPETYIGEKIKFKGKVIQVIEDPNSTYIELRIAVSSNYDKILYVGFDSSILSQRVLEDDQVTIYGISAGTITYESTMGGFITIPAASVDRLDFN